MSTSAWRRKNRKALRARQRDLCGICGERMVFEGDSTHDLFATIDHIVPRSLGGVNARTNLRLAHRKCNGERTNTPPLWWAPDMVKL